MPAQPAVHPLGAFIGAAISGVDLSAPLRPGVAEMIAYAVTDHQVVFVRDQSLDERQLWRLAEQFGVPAVHPVDRLASSGGSVSGKEVSSIRDTAARPPPAFDWHTDLSWTQTPPAWGFLHAVEIPRTGGDTQWASGFAMYDALGPRLARLCDRLSMVHRPSPELVASVRTTHGDRVAAQLIEQHAGAEHPLVRIHPRSGRRALWLSRLYAREVVGAVGIDSDTVARLVHRRLDDVRHQIRWRWREGDVAIWDEMSTCHRALGDHYPQPQTMLRCTIAGDRPFGLNLHPSIGRDSIS